MFAFDAIHDQVDPARVLARIHEALEPGGVFVMFDIKAASAVEDNIGNRLAPWLYGVSTLQEEEPKNRPQHGDQVLRRAWWRTSGATCSASGR